MEQVEVEESLVGLYAERDGTRKVMGDVCEVEDKEIVVLLFKECV